MLSECYRVLKPGGRIRVATPNLAEISRLVIDRNDRNCQEYIRFTVDTHISEIGIYEPAFVINNFFWDYGHLFAYDAKVLCGVLEAVGFRKISRCKPGCSEEPALTAIDSHGRLVGDAMNDYETMIFEAIKQD